MYAKFIDYTKIHNDYYRPLPYVIELIEEQDDAPDFDTYLGLMDRYLQFKQYCEEFFEDGQWSCIASDDDDYNFNTRFYFKERHDAMRFKLIV